MHVYLMDDISFIKAALYLLNSLRFKRLCIVFPKYHFKQNTFVEERFFNTKILCISTMLFFFSVMIGFDSCSTSWEKDSYG